MREGSEMSDTKTEDFLNEYEEICRKYNLVIEPLCDDAPLFVTEKSPNRWIPLPLGIGVIPFPINEMDDYFKQLRNENPTAE